jgi:hypothetical protein
VRNGGGLGGARFEVWGHNVKFNFDRKDATLVIQDGDRNVIFLQNVCTRSATLLYLDPTINGDNIFVQHNGGYLESTFIVFGAEDPTELTHRRKMDIPFTLGQVEKQIAESNQKKITDKTEAPFVWTSSDGLHRFEIWANLAILDISADQEKIVISDEHGNSVEVNHCPNPTHCRSCRYSSGVTVMNDDSAVEHCMNVFSTEPSYFIFPKLENRKDARDFEMWR